MCIKQIYDCNMLHRYILCVVDVIVCNEHWEQGIQLELTCSSKLFPCSPYQCQHHLNYIHITCPELSCFKVTIFQTFRFECMVSTCLCEQTAKDDRSHYNHSLNHYKLIRNMNLFQPYKISKFSDRLYTCIVNNCYTDTQNNLCIIW